MEVEILDSPDASAKDWVVLYNKCFFKSAHVTR